MFLDLYDTANNDRVCNLTIYWNVNYISPFAYSILALVCNLTIYWNVNLTR